MLARASLRYLLRYPWQLGLTVAGVAIGVAVVVAVDGATSAAERSFQDSMDAVSGRATHRVVGGAQGLNEVLYRKLRVGLVMRHSAPVLEGFVKVRGETLRLLGVDPIAEAPIRDYAAFGGDIPVDRLITEPGAVLLARATGTRLDLALGDRFNVTVSGRMRSVHLLAHLASAGQPRAAIDGLMIADIATAQTLLNRFGRLSGIDLKLPAGLQGERLRTRIAALLPADARIEPAAARSQAMAQMTHAFATNLTAMGLLALLIGMFLIYSTMSLSVLRRRSLIANLRMLGANRIQIFRLVLMEALGLSLLALAIGLPGGAVLAQGLLALVTRTINDLYFTLSVNIWAVDAATLTKGAALGIGASLLAALGPAVEAARATPLEARTRSHLERGARRLVAWLAPAGVAVMLAGALLLTAGQSLWLGFVALLLISAGYALITPAAVAIMMKLAQAPLASWFGLPGRLAARGAQASLSRTAVAIAALVVSVAATAGVTIMIDSFRGSVAAWLGSTLRADIYVTTPASDVEGAESILSPTLVRRIENVQGVADAEAHRWVTVQARTHEVRLHVIETSPSARLGFLIKAGDPQAARRAFRRGTAVLASEPYAYKHQRIPGDSIVLRTDHGERRFRIAGTFYDYGSDQGVVAMPRALYTRWWRDRNISSLGVRLSQRVPARQVQAQLRAAVHGSQPVLIRDTGELRAQTMAIFDRTFAITQVLRLLTVVVAVVGVLSAFMALLLERGKEFAVLRATGFTQGQIVALITGEAGLLGLCTGLLAMPLGVVMSVVLIEVINRRSFGWSMPVSIAPEALFHALALALAAALAASIYPGFKAATLRPAAGLRAE
ncbi:MAG: ABC transporter permease [Gammaproteobacteria bacterium]|nr:ABC transporter permease [Gammaproteobacteria bacterium]